MAVNQSSNLAINFSAVRISALLTKLFVCIWLTTSCSALKSGPDPVDEWLVKLQNVTAVKATYELEREQHYPLASHSPLFVKGEDRHIVENFESALNAHFQHVKIVDGQAPDASAGFVLELDKDQRARRLVIRITDLSSQKTFDRVKIDFSKERSLAVQKEPGSVDTHMGLALDAAAAKIAGSG